MPNEGLGSAEPRVRERIGRAGQHDGRRREGRDDAGPDHRPSKRAARPVVLVAGEGVRVRGPQWQGEQRDDTGDEGEEAIGSGVLRHAARHPDDSRSRGHRFGTPPRRRCRSRGRGCLGGARPEPRRGRRGARTVAGRARCDGTRRTTRSAAREQRAERRSEHPPAEPRAQHGASHSDSELHAHADRPRDPDEVHPLQPLRQTLSDRQRDEQRSRDDEAPRGRLRTRPARSRATRPSPRAGR